MQNLQKLMASESALYGELAKYYDLIYHWKDYRSEAEKIRQLIRRYKRAPGNSLLDVGCGTGMHIRYLKKDFECVGIDDSPEMLRVARKRVAGVGFEEGDMVDFNLGRRFDIVTCLFSGIGYLRTRSKIGKALKNFSGHLRIGGVLIIEPWIRRSEWRDRTVHLQRYESDDLKIARIDYGRARGKFSILDERYLIAVRGRGVSYLKTKHVMRFFEPREMLKLMRRNGLDSVNLKESLMPGRGLLIGVKTDDTE